MIEALTVVLLVVAYFVAGILITGWLIRGDKE